MSDVEQVPPPTVILEERHRPSTAAIIGVSALAVSAIIGFVGMFVASRGAEARAASSRRLNFEVIADLQRHSATADCRAEALSTAEVAQAELLVVLADGLAILARNPQNLNQYVGLLRQQSRTLEAAISQQKVAVAKCGDPDK